MPTLTTVLLATPRGFCAGVDRAVDIVELALELYGAPVYMRHEIVHNQTVVKALEVKGAVFVERTDEIPEGAVTVFSAHGVSPQVRSEAVARKLRVIDATCPLVTKVHLEAIRYSREGYSIILVGHRGHVEMEGTMGEAPGSTTLIETVEDARTVAISDPAKVVCLTQTTLSIDDTATIIATLKERFPTLTLPPKQDICYATTNRQAAVKELAKASDVVLVVGGVMSSNSNRLAEVAEHAGTPAHRLLTVDELDERWLDGATTVGITSGASTPESSVTALVNRLQELGAREVRELTVLNEVVRFILPRDLVVQANDAGKGNAILAKHEIRPEMKLHVS